MPRGSPRFPRRCSALPRVRCLVGGSSCFFGRLPVGARECCAWRAGVARSGDGRRGGEPRVQSRLRSATHRAARRILDRGAWRAGRILRCVRRRVVGRPDRSETASTRRWTSALSPASMWLWMTWASTMNDRLRQVLHDYFAWATTVIDGPVPRLGRRRTRWSAHSALVVGRSSWHRDHRAARDHRCQPGGRPRAPRRAGRGTVRVIGRRLDRGGSGAPRRAARGTAPSTWRASRSGS